MKIFKMDGKIKLLCLVYFMVAQSSMMARATSDSFLLKYFEAESIPLMIMAAASLSIVLAIFTTYLCGRFQAYGAMKIATAGLVCILGVVIALVFLFCESDEREETKAIYDFETKAIYAFAYMICEVIVILPMVLFWGMAVGVLNPTESKKWMGMIGAAGTCGCILAGYTISWVSEAFYVNELSLGLVAAVLLVVSFILMARSKLLTIDDDGPVPAQSSSILRKLAVLISSRQSVLMTGLVVFSAIVMSLIDINFKFEVRDYFSEKPAAELYDFFGQFYTYTSIAQLILQLLVVRAILMRGGVLAAISILPILLLLTSVFALFVGDRYAVGVSKFITQVVFFTIEYVGLQMLFLSVKKKMRGQMNSAVDGLTRPATIAAISLLITSTLLFWKGEESVFRLNSIIICLCCIWLFVSFLNYRQYLISLVTNLKAKVIGRLGKEECSFDDTSELRDIFKSADEDKKQLIGELLVDGRAKGWDAEFRELLKYDREDLALPAIRYLCEHGNSNDFDQILERVQRGAVFIKLEFLRSCSMHVSQDDLKKLEPFLDDPSPKVRFSGAALLRSFDHEAKGKAEEVCGQFIESAYPEDRLLLVDCLSSLENLDNSFFIDEILATADDELNFGPGLFDAKSLSKLSEKFAERLKEGDGKGIDARFLERIGAPAKVLVRKELSQIKYSDAKRRFADLLGLLVQVGKPLDYAVFSTYVGQVSGDSDRARLVCDYFHSNSSRLPLNCPKGFAKKELVRAMSGCSFYLDLLGRLGSEKQFDALKLALDNQYQIRLKTLLSIMPVFNNEIDYAKLMNLICRKEANAKAEALEVLKGVLGPKSADQLISVFQPSAGAVEKADDLSMFVKKLSTSDSRWILSGLMLAFSEDDFSVHEEFVRDCLANDDELVRETALHVYVLFQTKAHLVEEQCSRFANDPSPKVAWIANDRLSLT
jgi:ATP/ADP translocase